MNNLELNLWGMPLQNREFRNKTNENWKRIMAWSAAQNVALTDIYNYINFQLDAERKSIDEEIANEANKRKTADERLENKFSQIVEELAKRIDNIITEGNGDSNLEIVDSRTDAHGHVSENLKKRLDRDQLFAEGKSTVRYDLETAIEMDKQDVAFLFSGTTGGRDNVVFLNASSDDKNSLISIERKKEVSSVPISDGLILAKFGDEERYDKTRTAILKQTEPFSLAKDSYIQIFCLGEINKMSLFKVNDKGEDEQVKMAGWKDGYTPFYAKNLIADKSTRYKLKAHDSNGNVLASMSVIVS